MLLEKAREAREDAKDDHKPTTTKAVGEKCTTRRRCGTVTHRSDTLLIPAWHRLVLRSCGDVRKQLLKEFRWHEVGKNLKKLEELGEDEEPPIHVPQRA